MRQDQKIESWVSICVDGDLMKEVLERETRSKNVDYFRIFFQYKSKLSNLRKGAMNITKYVIKVKYTIM